MPSICLVYSIVKAFGGGFLKLPKFDFRNPANATKPNRTAITDSSIPNILAGGCRTSWGGAAMPGAAAGLPMFGIGRQSRTRQSRTSWAGIAAQPGAATGLGNPNILGPAVAEHPGAAARLCRARRRDCRCSESDGNHGLGNPEHPCRHSSATRGGGRGGGSRGGIGRQSRTRQSRTSWAAVAEHPGAAARLCRARRRDCRCSESDGNHGLGNPEHPGPA